MTEEMKASDPAAPYQASYLQGLKKRLMMSIDETNEQEKLEQCLELLCADSMPGVYTEEEFDEVIRKSEASGNASPEKVKTFFAQWGL